MEITEFEKNGKKQVFKPVFGSIAELLDHHARKFGKKEAIVEVNVDSGEKRVISYSELEELAKKTASFLAEKGVQKGDRIAFAFENTATILLLEFAAGLLGASSVPIDVKRDTPERRKFKLEDSNAKLFFEDEEEVLQKLQDFSLQSSVIFSGSIQDEYLLLYTSGTTANPKGVSLKLRSVMANAQGIAEWQQLGKEDRFQIVLPLHHINSTTMSFATLLAGGTVILNSRYSASKFWEVASKYKSTLCSIVPTILHDLLVRKEEFLTKKQPLYFKRILVGSAPVLPDETLKFMDAFDMDVVQGYGQTETALRVTGVPVDLPKNVYRELTRKNSIGKELAYCNVTVLREDGSEAVEKEEGEICIRGPVLGDGYVRNEKETKKAFSGGWFHAEDLGYYEVIGGEKYFFIKGRMKEIIIKGGVNISPAAVEDVLLKSFSEIDEICVVGYEDSRMGEEVAAVVTLRDLKAGESLEEKIVRFSSEGKVVGLSRYEAPAKVFVVKDELPKTSTGKIQRIKVKEMVASLVAKEDTQHVYCRLIEPTEHDLIKRAVGINNKRWLVEASEDEFGKRAKNGYLIGVFDERGNLLGTVSALQIRTTVLDEVKTWQEATAQGTLETHDPKGEVFLCAAISVVPDKSVVGSDPTTLEVSDRVADAVIADYVKTDLDNVLRFHRKPKGGMEKGAEVIKVLPQGRPEDEDAMGYNVLVEYPSLKGKKIVKSKNVSPSVLLIEKAMLVAKERGCKRVVAFSRPAQFRLHLAKAMGNSIDFEPKDAKEFEEFVEKVKNVA
jgi:long-chain acyl-CoA synthetase